MWTFKTNSKFVGNRSVIKLVFISFSVSNVFIRVVVAISPDLISISSVIGWIYFVAWSVSFYPQIYINYKRKSVVGLNFDFLALNIVGFLLYGIFNIGLYSIPEVQKEYAHRFPRGLNPVHLNDVFFAFHAAIASFITIIQCFCYEVSNNNKRKKQLFHSFKIINFNKIFMYFTACWSTCLELCSITFRILYNSRYYLSDIIYSQCDCLVGLPVHLQLH